MIMGVQIDGFAPSVFVMFIGGSEPRKPCSVTVNTMVLAKHVRGPRLRCGVSVNLHAPFTIASASEMICRIYRALIYN